MMDAFQGSGGMVYELMADAKVDKNTESRVEMRQRWWEEQGRVDVEHGSLDAGGGGVRSGHSTAVQTKRENSSLVNREASQRRKKQRTGEWLDLSPSGYRQPGSTVEETENQFVIDLHGLSQVQ
jgi:hypothetical protein